MTASNSIVDLNIVGLQSSLDGFRDRARKALAGSEQARDVPEWARELIARVSGMPDLTPEATGYDGARAARRYRAMRTPLNGGDDEVAVICYGPTDDEEAFWLGGIWAARGIREVILHLGGRFWTQRWEAGSTGRITILSRMDGLLRKSWNTTQGLPAIREAVRQAELRAMVRLQRSTGRRGPTSGGARELHAPRREQCGESSLVTATERVRR